MWYANGHMPGVLPLGTMFICQPKKRRLFRFEGVSGVPSNLIHDVGSVLYGYHQRIAECLLGYPVVELVYANT